LAFLSSQLIAQQWKLLFFCPSHSYLLQRLLRALRSRLFLLRFFNHVPLTLPLLLFVLVFEETYFLWRALILHFLLCVPHKFTAFPLAPLFLHGSGVRSPIASLFHFSRACEYRRCLIQVILSFPFPLASVALIYFPRNMFHFERVSLLFPRSTALKGFRLLPVPP